MEPSNEIDVLTISIATNADAAKLTQLLMESYRSQSDFTMHTNSYYENHFQAGQSSVLLAHSGSELLGTMRARIVGNSKDLDFEDEGHLTPELAPALCLERAATISDKRARGVNSALRLFCIEAALELRLMSVVGFVYESAPRTKLMAELGYSFYPVKSSRDGYRTDHSTCSFAALDLRTVGRSALSLLHARKNQQGLTLDWKGPLLQDRLRAKI